MAGMGDYTVNIDIEKLVKNIKHYEKIPSTIEQGIKLGIDAFSEALHKQVIANLVKYGLGNSALARSIAILPLPTGVSIMVGAEYAMYIEYGTGVKGANSPYDRASHGIAWEYDVNNHGWEGWWYPTTADDPNPKKRQNKDGTWYAWTAGQASRPFMYDTWLWGTRSAYNIIAKHVRQELKKVAG